MPPRATFHAWILTSNVDRVFVPELGEDVLPEGVATSPMHDEMQLADAIERALADVPQASTYYEARKQHQILFSPTHAVRQLTALYEQAWRTR